MSLGDLATALCKAQSEMKNPPMNREGHHKNKYADLAACLDAIREPLAKNGLAFTQIMRSTNDNQTFLVTTVIHASGQSLESQYRLPDPATTKPQEFGSSLSYAKRYALCAMFGINGEMDDDGQTAVAPAPRKSFPNSAPGTVSENQIKRLWAIAKKHEYNAEDLRGITMAWFKLDSPKLLNKTQYDAMIDAIETHPKDEIMEMHKCPGGLK